ncbi:MAG: hypothetical protein Q4F71_04445 [Paracoccus sp. (in: a-proteobacteria)]|nr:hypothetical protein [Paracoccus sp. (in: a-proteobacteria)]
MNARAAIVAGVLAGALALPAQAQIVRHCHDDAAPAWAIGEPWEENTAVYAEGRVRLAVIDRIEPAAAAVWLLILSPPLDEVGGRQCRLVGLSEGSGFLDLDFAARTAEYDAASGLSVSMPALHFDPDSVDGIKRQLTVTINQSTGEIAARSVK